MILDVLCVIFTFVTVFSTDWVHVIFKTSASLCFLTKGYIKAKKYPSRYATLVLVGLFFSLIGDVLLTQRNSEMAFQLGGFSFLITHVLYTISFVWTISKLKKANWNWILIFSIGIAICTGGVLMWLIPKTPKHFLPLILSYTFVISVMVALSPGGESLANTNTKIRVMAAVLFYLSDLTVAKDRFVKHELVNRLIGLPLYFVAQLMFASSIGQ